MHDILMVQVRGQWVALPRLDSLKGPEQGGSPSVLVGTRDTPPLWVTVENRGGIASGNALHKQGQSCLLDFPARLRRISETSDLWAVVSIPQGTAYGSECPAGTWFRLDPEAREHLRPWLGEGTAAADVVSSLKTTLLPEKDR